MLGLINVFFFVFFLRKLLENMISQYEGLNSERRREVQETRDLTQETDEGNSQDDDQDKSQDTRMHQPEIINHLDWRRRTGQMALGGITLRKKQNLKDCLKFPFILRSALQLCQKSWRRISYTNNNKKRKKEY